MAAMLIEIKSRMLLPVRRPTPARKPEDPRAELVRRLLEYEQMKLAAQRLDHLPQLERDFMRADIYIEQSAEQRFPDVDVERPARRLGRRDSSARSSIAAHHIRREELSVREHMSGILLRLRGKRFVEFSELFNSNGGMAELVVTFLALLELIRDHQVEVTQHQTFGTIYVSPIDAIENA